MAAVSVRDLDESVRERLRIRAAQHGRSMEAEIRAILTDAVTPPVDQRGLAPTLLARFGDLGGVELELPPHAEVPRAAEDVFAAFADRVLAFDAEAASQYARIVVQRELSGAPISGFDAQIAAICRSHRAALVTRNTSDFDHLSLDLVNPWLIDT